MFSGYIYMHIYKAQKIFVANKNNFQSQQLKYLSVRLSHKAKAAATTAATVFKCTK